MQKNSNILSEISFNSLQTNSTFQMLLENMPVLLYVYQGDKVIYVNPAVEKALGYTLDEMLEFNFWDICHADYKDLIRERGYARLKGDNVPTNYEFIILKKNGEPIWVDVFFARTEIHGLPLSIVGAIDITEKKELQKRLVEANEELEKRVLIRTRELSEVNQELVNFNENLNNVIQNMSDGVVIIDETGNLEVLNPVIEKIWGKLLEQIKTQIKDNLLSGKAKFIDKMLNKKIAFQNEEIIFSTHQGPVHFLASGTPILKQNSPINKGVIIIRPIKEVHRLINKFTGAQARYSFSDILTNNDLMQNVIKQAEHAAKSISNILVQGESGTGKEMFAQAIHLASNRKNGPFIAVNCGAIPRDLVGSELFGYAEGAFTGAKREGNPGKFELASGGTLFLDEIGDMPFEQQATLLRAIQERAITRIGGNQIIPVDVRIICATNKNLQKEMEKGNFRSDLYYRLNVIFLSIPPLRDRPEDIPLLTKLFIKKLSIKTGQKYFVSDILLNKLIDYSWPGNVRELENILERLINQIPDGELDIRHLPSELSAQDSNEKLLENYAEPKKISLLEARNKKLEELQATERKQIIQLLEIHQGNISQVAREMGLARSTIYKKLRQYHL